MRVGPSLPLSVIPELIRSVSAQMWLARCVLALLGFGLAFGTASPMACPADPDTDTAEGVRSLALFFCKAGVNLSRAGEDDCAKLAEVLKAFLRKHAEDTAKKHPQQAALASYISDATSFRCESTSTGFSHGKQVVRRGKVLEEFLMQRICVYVVTPLGGREAAVIVADPKPLSKGKKSANLFAAGAKYFPVLRSFGRTGIVIFHLGADRAVLSSLDRLFGQRQKAFYTPGLGPDLGDEATLLENTDLYVNTGCALHDLSNSIQWGLASVAGGEVVQDIHIVIESCRNSFAFIQANLAKFLVLKLGFVQPPADTEPVLRFWKAMGIDTDWLEVLGFLNPWWDSGRLLVSEAAKDDPDLIGKVSDVILYLWRWKKFVVTRWCTVGPSCRALVVSLCVGLEEIVAMTLADESTTNFHLHGFSKLSSDVKMYACVAAVASYPADSLQLMLMEDDRVAGRLPELKEAFYEEVRWVEGLDDFTWGRLAHVAGGGPGSSPYDLRSCALTAVHISSSYICRKLFNVAGGLPWSLCVGDISLNLQCLEDEGYDGDDPTVLKILELMRLGYNRQRLAEGISLLRDIPWSTVTVEQAHGSMAAIHRLHPTFSSGVLAHRTMVHQCRNFFNKPQEEKAIERVEQKAEALRSKMPQRAHARQLFLRELIVEAKAALTPGAKMSRELRQELMRQHSKLFQDLDPAKKRALEIRAASFAAAQKRSTSEDLEHVNTHLALHQARLTEERLNRGLTNRLSEHRFSENDLLALGKLWRSRDFQPAEVTLLRARALEAPEAPSESQRAALAGCDVPRKVPEGGALEPECLRHICHRRADYRGCALFSGDLDLGSKAYLFLYATQKPQAAMFLELQRTVRQIPRATCLEALLDSSDSAVYEFEFNYNPPRYCQESDLPFPNIEELAVLPDLHFDPSGHLTSDSKPVPWLKMALELPMPDAAPRKERATGPSKSEREDLMEKHPWLREALGLQRDLDPPDIGQSSGSAAEPEEATQDVIEAALQEVYNKRSLWELEGLDTLEDFRTKILGDDSTGSDAKLEFASIAGVACGASAVAWCRTYGMSLQASFSHRKYSYLDASMMALEWCRRMQHFFDIHKAQECADYIYSTHDLGSYAEGLEWVSYLCGLDIESTAWSRSEVIRALVPNREPATTFAGAASSSKRRRD